MDQDLVINQDIGSYTGWMNDGLKLSEMPMNEGGWAELFDPQEGLDITDNYMRAATTIMLENCKQWQAKLCRGQMRNGKMVLNEATRSALVGGFSDHLFPIIRAAFPSNPVTDLISVQPTTRRVATVVFWNWIYGSNKGTISRGQRLFDANTGVPIIAGTPLMADYTGEDIIGESGGAGDGSTHTITGTLTYNDGGGIRPGSVAVSLTDSLAGAVTFADTGLGSFVQSGGTAVNGTVSGTINYMTGVYAINTSGSGNFTTAAISINYSYNSEGSQLTPEVDVQIITSTTETQRRALKLKYSMEGVQDVMAEFGTSLEPNLVSGAAELLNMEIATQIIRRMWQVASVYGSFANAQGSTSAISLEQYLRSIMLTLNGMSNTILQNTQKGYGNWLVADANACTLIETLPRDLFEPAPRPANIMGLHFIGTLGGKLRVYKWIHLSREAGASAQGNILMGFKGSSFWEAGLVWAPYQLMYTTDSLTTADFITQKGMASRYALKMVNPLMYLRLNITQAS